MGIGRTPLRAEPVASRRIRAPAPTPRRPGRTSGVGAGRGEPLPCAPRRRPLRNLRWHRRRRDPRARPTVRPQAARNSPIVASHTDGTAPSRCGNVPAVVPPGAGVVHGPRLDASTDAPRPELLGADAGHRPRAVRAVDDRRRGRGRAARRRARDRWTAAPRVARARAAAPRGGARHDRDGAVRARTRVVARRVVRSLPARRGLPPAGPPRARPLRPRPRARLRSTPTCSAGCCRARSRRRPRPATRSPAWPSSRARRGSRGRSFRACSTRCGGRRG